MYRRVAALAFCVVLALAALGQQRTSQAQGSPNNPPPRSERDREAGESSSRNTKIDLSPPKDDAQNHPFSSSSVTDSDAEASGNVQEFHAWDPHKAAKDVEVGDFYFKKKNYRAALSRYREALHWKSNDAVATFRTAQCLEKLNQPEESRRYYEGYLKILPNGPFAAEANKALERLKSAAEKSQASELSESKQ